ncbi:uncharacterized protein LOC119898653 isoform X2 [Micropterus salmoides]|uniref:uncharacterized protein LOC119898653 isoform X2 n=1 Tax=Micropterus salmoides TaxID=27706 RepID=UPI0018EA8CDD|nr:uncharacterized protein LOC119898653 isoform X2 [Micropterus salmoides]
MLLAAAECVLMGFILYISGIQGQANHICALKGSSVDLPCSAQHPTSSIKWYTIHITDPRSTYVLNELSADGNHVTYNMSEKSIFTLTINDLRESDEKFYCCKETTDKPENCWHNRTELHIADLQVKVIPATEGQTVTLMCNTSCPLTENPAAYIWYRNREFLYQDWSPWYQQLVSSDKAVRYSCAIKGYEGLRAPEVSVDSVTPTCFNVTYAKGMCSVDKPCSTTYPTGLDDSNCLSVNYVSRRICALEGSSVNITSESSGQSVNSWNKVKRRDEEDDETLTDDAGRVEFHVIKNYHIMSINNLMKNDSAEYTFTPRKYKQGRTQSDLSGVTLVVTGLRVKFTPSAEVTEGQRVTLTCSTSCPLTDNTNYIWYLNSRRFDRAKEQKETAGSRPGQ